MYLESSGKFLGFMVSQGGIEANLEKVKAILDMTSPRKSKGGKKIDGMNHGFEQVHL